MATNMPAVLANLTEFYDFRDKSVLHVGAGGGQLVGYATRATRVLAVDNDPAGVAALQSGLAAAGLNGRVAVRLAPFDSIADEADLVFFEFCLHEMDDPYAMLCHARTLASETLVIDHAPDSLWAWYTAETGKATASWAAVERLGICREERYSAWQHFPDGDALFRKLEALGDPAISRAKAHAGPLAIDIPMAYRIALL